MCLSEEMMEAPDNDDRSKIYSVNIFNRFLYFESVFLFWPNLFVWGFHNVDLELFLNRGAPDSAFKKRS